MYIYLYIHTCIIIHKLYTQYIHIIGSWVKNMSKICINIIVENVYESTPHAHEYNTIVLKCFQKVQ